MSEARGVDRRLDAYLDRLADELAGLRSHPEAAEAAARRLVERMALAFQGALLVRVAPPPVAGAFLAARLTGDGGRAFGALPASVDAGAIAAILDRHAVEPEA